MKNNSQFKKNKKYRERYYKVAIVIGLLLYTIPVYAADDPISVISNLSDLIFGITKAVGIIIMGFSAVQFGISLKNQDPSQRANAVFSIAGGAIIYFSKEIITRLLG